jgi:intein-encoded DNA endonuclease-like protein
MDFAMAMRALLWKNTEGVFPPREFHLRVYFHMFTRQCETCCLPSVSVQCEREVVPDINKQNILGWFREDHNSTHRIASHIGVSHMQVQQTFHEEELCLYHKQNSSL